MEEVKVQTPYKESVAEGFRRAAQDPEMLSMEEERIADLDLKEEIKTFATA